MCGIVGIADSSTPGPEVRQILQHMADAIRHRGPDDEGFFVADDIGLGMRRLSIIDLAGGHQPICNEDGSVVVVFNGEIYNYRELREQLRWRGHRFTTDSDTEVIVHLYEEEGEGCLQQLRGMFGLAIWDTRKQRLFVARDRLGIKPLYYTRVGEGLVFASEIKAMLQHPNVSVTPNLDAIGCFLSLKYVPAPHTMFAGIQSLAPGHSLTWDRNGVRVKCYWDLSFVQPQSGKSEDAYAEELDEMLQEAVRLRLRSDVPFGAFLSGGVDSSIIVALMSQMLDEPVKTFSVGFTGPPELKDELPHARRVAKQYKTDHHEIVMGPQHFEDLAEKVTWHLDQPIADQATLATYMVSELASEHVKMVLTGEGGDELFAGYARYSGERFSPLFGLLPRPLKSMALAASGRISGLRRAKLALYALCHSDEVTRFANWFPLFNTDMKAELVNGSLKRKDGLPAQQVFADHLTRTDATGTLNRMLYVDTKLWLPDFLLLRGDKMSMANSLEARVPFLDHKLVEFAATLPPRLKLNGFTRKYLLKKVSRNYLPTEIVDRKKEGFPIPFSAWFRRELREYLCDMLSRETIQRRGLFNPDYVDELVRQRLSGFADNGNLLWGLISIELWHRLYVDSPPRKSFHESRAVQIA